MGFDIQFPSEIIDAMHQDVKAIFEQNNLVLPYEKLFSIWCFYEEKTFTITNQRDTTFYEQECTQKIQELIKSRENEGKKVVIIDKCINVLHRNKTCIVLGYCMDHDPSSPKVIFCETIYLSTPTTTIETHNTKEILMKIICGLTGLVGHGFYKLMYGSAAQ